MIVFFLPLFGHNPGVMLCQKKEKNKSQRGTNGLATHTDLEAERQQSKNSIERPVINTDNHLILRKFSAGVRMGSL